MNRISKARAKMYYRARVAIAAIEDEATRNRATLAMDLHVAHMKFAYQGSLSTFGKRPDTGRKLNAVSFRTGDR